MDRITGAGAVRRLRMTGWLAFLVLAACASQVKPTASLPDPPVAIEQLSSVSLAARNITGGITLHYLVRVQNVAGQPVTLRRIDMNSIGYGSYSVDQTSRPFNVTIDPQKQAEVEIWTSGQIVDASLTGANGPVTLRAVLWFDSPVGSLQTVVIQQVRPQNVSD